MYTVNMDYKDIEYKRLGTAGLKISPLCLGTMTFGAGADAKESFAIMDYFVEQGYNFLDTADVYNGGTTEEIVSKWMRERGNRDSIILATKVYGRTGDGPNDQGLSRCHIQKAVDASLRRLQTDVIDIYQIHRWDPGTPVDETLDALDDLIKKGKVRYIGCSNLKAWHLQRFLDYSDRAMRARFISVQPVYNALNRGIESELLEVTDFEGIGVIPYNPLAGGVLTGKYTRGKKPPQNTRLHDKEFYYHRYYSDTTFDIVEKFVEYAEKRGVTPAQLALAWVMAEERVTAPIIGARSVEQLKDTIQGARIGLSYAERLKVPAIGACKWVGKDPVYDREVE